MPSLTPPPKPEDEADSRTSSLGHGMNLGVNLLSSIVVGAAMGYGLDKLFGTLPLFMIVMCFVGFGAGLRSIWKVIQNKPNPPAP